VTAVPAAARDTPRGQRELEVIGMMLEEPSIEARVVEIYQHIPNGQLAIFPNATQMIRFDDPVTFNGTVERFLRTPFVKRDRRRLQVV
jgi:hypothetical protein